MGIAMASVKIVTLIVFTYTQQYVVKTLFNFLKEKYEILLQHEFTVTPNNTQFTNVVC